MSIKIMSEVWANMEIKRPHLLTMLCIADMANEDTREAWPSIKTLAFKTRTGPRRIQDLIGELVDANLIEVRLNAGPNGVNIYRVLEGGAKIPPPAKIAPPPCKNVQIRCGKLHPPPAISNISHIGDPSKNRKEPSNEPEAAVLFGKPELIEAWEEWKQYRKERKKPITPSTAKRQLKTLSDMGPERAIRALHHSIEKGWEGIFEPNNYETNKTASSKGNGNNGERNHSNAGWGEPLPDLLPVPDTGNA